MYVIGRIDMTSVKKLGNNTSTILKKLGNLGINLNTKELSLHFPYGSFNSTSKK